MVHLFYLPGGGIDDMPDRSRKHRLRDLNGASDRHRWRSYRRNRVRARRRLQRPGRRRPGPQRRVEGRGGAGPRSSPLSSARPPPRRLPPHGGHASRRRFQFSTAPRWSTFTPSLSAAGHCDSEARNICSGSQRPAAPRNFGSALHGMLGCPVARISRGCGSTNDSQLSRHSRRRRPRSDVRS